MSDSCCLCFANLAALAMATPPPGTLEVIIDAFASGAEVNPENPVTPNGFTLLRPRSLMNAGHTGQVSNLRTRLGHCSCSAAKDKQ